jgi:hypothetical protein
MLQVILVDHSLHLVLYSVVHNFYTLFLSGTKGATGRNLWSPHRFTPLNGVRVRLVASGSNSVHSIIVTEEGRAMSLGKTWHSFSNCVHLTLICTER